MAAERRAASAAAATSLVSSTNAKGAGSGQGSGGAGENEARQRSGGLASTSSPGLGAAGAGSAAGASGAGASEAQQWPQRLIVELPLPSQRTGFLGRGAPDPGLIALADESDYPGGEVQRFRVIKRLVDELLEGYDAQFLGMLEDGADGVGLWSLEGATVIANVTNATVPSLVKLLDGGYGARVTEPGHVLIAVNPQWTDADSVGQPWQWSLRRRAAAALAPGAWDTLYLARVVRGSRGASGLLARAWPHRWALYPAATPDTRCLGDCVLATPGRPPSATILERLNESKAEMQRKAKELGLEEAGWF